MDTSDSECFESADEDFEIDHKNVNKTKTSLSSSNKKTGGDEVKELDLKAEQLTIDESTKNLTEEKSSNENDTNKLNRVSAAQRREKAEKRPKQIKSKLGTKLGTKISGSSSGLSSQKNITNKCDVNAQFNENKKETLLEDFKKICNLSKAGKIEFANELDMWGDDEDWGPAAPVDSKSGKTNEESTNSGWSGWGNWDVTSLISTATMGVTTITNHVSHGLTTVLESGIGAVPEPEELARLHKVEKRQEEVDESSNVPESTRSAGPDLTSFGLGSFVSGVSQITKLVETTGNAVVSKGLDTLETIGKKTMEVLQEGDPGLKKKRAFLKIDSNKPVLSTILREAKEKAEEENKLAEERHIKKKANYETLFDDHQGLAHLEALEMLSRQCDIKLKTLLESQSGGELIEMQETMNQIKELCEITEEDEDEKEDLDEAELEEKLNAMVTELNISISYSRLLSTWKDIDGWLDDLDLNSYNATQLHEESINILAQFTAVAVEFFHKTGELLLIKEHRSTVDEADSLVQLTTTMTTLISSLAKKASNNLNEKASQTGNKDNINQFITNVYFEATNSSSYIKNAFELLIPVLQVGAV